MLTALVTIAIFLVMISIHEFGHFIVAKLCGITVLEFAIGMGPTIFKKEKGGTLYSVRILPIGGYCKMEGEDIESEDEGAFCNQNLLKRFLVVVAGAVLNILLGFSIFLVIAGQSAPFATNTVETLDERSSMYLSGVMPGDVISKINGKKIGFYRDIVLYRDEMKAEAPVEIEVKRNGERMKFVFSLSHMTGVRRYGETGYTETTTMNGITETVEGKYSEGTVIPEELIGYEQELDGYLLGFSPVVEQISAKGTIREAFYNTRYVIRIVYKGLFDMITGRAGFEQVSGPVGIVSAVNTAVKSQASLLSVLSLAALLTINLGIFNLLPIPALDGGRIFFMLIELIRRKPVPAEKEGLIHAIGLMLLLGFALIVSAKDIIMLFK